MKLQLANGYVEKPLGILEQIIVTSCGIDYEHTFAVVDFGKTNNFDIILERPFMRQLKMIQDCGYDQIYLRHKELVTKTNMKDHSYRDVAKTPVQEFDSTTINGKEVPAWMQTKAHIWMCGPSESGDLTKEECILERSVTDEAYIPEPFPEHLFEPFGWTQILSTLDICVNKLTPTKFCDEEGYDLVTLQMASVILESGSKRDEKEKLTRRVEWKRIVDEISVIDIEKRTEDDFMDSLSEDLPLSDERSSESESERKNIPQSEKFYDFSNQKPRWQERYRQRRTTSSAASSRSTRSKKSSSEEERTDTDKEQDSQESAQEDVPKEVEAAGPSEYEGSDEEDTSTPLEKRSQKPRSREQVLMDEAMARVEARRKELADTRAAKAAKMARPMIMEEARKIRIEKAKAIQKERRRIEADKKAQEEAEAIQTQEKELAREKIKETLSRKAEKPVLEPTKGSPKRPRQEEEEDIEHIQADPIPPSPINIPLAPPSSPITLFPPASTLRTPPSPSPLDLPKSPPAPTSPQQQQLSAEPIEVQSLQEETEQPMDKTKEEEKQTDSEPHKPADIDLSISIIQLDEPTNEEAVEEVKNFDYTIDSDLVKAIQMPASSGERYRYSEGQGQQSSQLTRKEAQNHELIKNEKKMKEQLKYEDARFQKLTASYNTVKTTLTALLQNQEPASTPSTSDSATANTLAALQEELQTEKLQR
ncbi:hypothetical protein L7F22_017498 [Adiantum nelumboides]|nr:hypothetical protein [Adiantum nelumboides]